MEGAPFFIYDGHCYLLRFIEAVVDLESRGFHSFYYIEHYQMQYMFNQNICSIKMFEYYVKKKKKPLPIVSRPSGPSFVKPKKVSFGPIGTECAGSGRRPRGGRRPTGRACRLKARSARPEPFRPESSPHHRLFYAETSIFTTSRNK